MSFHFPVTLGAAAEHEEWLEKHEKARMDKQDIKVVSVLSATCSDDGTANIWKPLEVN